MLIILLIPRPSPSVTLFPYTTLFRSLRAKASGDSLGTFEVRVHDPNQLSVRTGGDVGGVCHTDAARADETERSEEHTSELQSPCNLVCRLLLEKKKIK